MWGRISAGSIGAPARRRLRSGGTLLSLLSLVGATLLAQGLAVSPIGGATAAGAATQTVVTLGFDDGYASQYQTLAMLNAHSMHGTYYINSGTRPPEYDTLSWAQLHDLANAGNEIGGHTIDHADLPT